MNSLLRDIADDVIAKRDAEAGRRGLSRSEYLRRTLTLASVRAGNAVAVADVSRFAETFADLADPDVMAQAWR